MLDNEIELVRALSQGVSQATDSVLERIMMGSDPNEAKAQLKRLALQYPAQSPLAWEAITYYRGMRAALSEDDSRWLQFHRGADPSSLRRERLRSYNHYRELFEREVKATRRQKAVAMALAKDWSGMGSYVGGALRIVRSRSLLRMAGILYRLNVRGPLDLCDAAAFDLLRAAYLPS